MTNANVRIEYDLSTGRANFYWQNSLKISGFYAGVGLDTYITGTVYTNRTWTVTNDQVVITSTRGDLPTMKQTFILDQDNSFLTRLDMVGNGLHRAGWGRWSWTFRAAWISAATATIMRLSFRSTMTRSRSATMRCPSTTPAPATRRRRFTTTRRETVSSSAQ
ncbi:MAG: hypothetical protein WDM76_04645 [Limisphaerales bacterium]